MKSLSLATILDRYQPEGDAETTDVRRVRALVESAADTWRRDLPLHVTASALIVDPPTGRVLLRWHQRQRAWLQVGGHGDPGESDPVAIALREAAEETGLPDLAPWPDTEIRHVVIVNVPAGKREPAHEHADVRFFMTTRAPDAARAENDDAPLRWLSLAAARDATSEANLRETLSRLERMLAQGGQVDVLLVSLPPVRRRVCIPMRVSSSPSPAQAGAGLPVRRPPSVRARQLAAEIRRLRQERGRSRADFCLGPVGKVHEPAQGQLIDPE